MWSYCHPGHWLPLPDLLPVSAFTWEPSCTVHWRITLRISKDSWLVKPIALSRGTNVARTGHERGTNVARTWHDRGTTVARPCWPFFVAHRGESKATRFTPGKLLSEKLGTPAFMAWSPDLSRRFFDFGYGIYGLSISLFWSEFWIDENE
jgi:hypothetical protein